MSMQNALEKIRTFEGRTVLHPRHIRALERLDECYALTVETKKTRSVMVVGESGVGKSTLMNAFVEKYPRKETRNQTIIAVLVVSVPSSPSKGAMADAILTKFGDIYVRGSVQDKRARILLLMKQCGVKCLVLDEFQHFIDRGGTRTYSAVADWIKEVMNEAGVSVIAFGLQNGLLMLRSNSQMRRRFSSSINLLPWSLDTDEDRLEFRRLIKAFEKAMELPEQSLLYGEEMATRIYFACDGKIGYLAPFLSRALYLSLINGGQKVELEHLNRAFIDQIWGSASSKDNPFSADFTFRRLNRLGEPFEPPLI